MGGISTRAGHRSSEPPLRKCRSYLGEWAQPHRDPDCGHQPEWSHFGQRRFFGNELLLAPPCRRHRPFFIAGDRQGLPLLVRAPHW